MSETFRYAAFVSYSSNDAPFAKRLHRAIENYGIPSALGKFDLLNAGNAGNRIYPVFRDREELSAGDLGERIQDALRSSRSLIVICSPYAAASQWVQKEIEYFISLGRRDQVFAIIAANAPLRGLVGEDATLLSFPPALLADAAKSATAQEPVAADARPGKDGFRNACLKLIAGVLAVTPGQLIDRDRRRRLRARIALGVSGAAVAAAAALGVALFSERDWRGEALRIAATTIAEGRNLDALPLAIAAAPPGGSLSPSLTSRADSALARAGALRIWRELGPSRGSLFYFRTNPSYLIAQPESAPSRLYDLTRPTAAQDLGYVPPNLFRDPFYFSDDGKIMAVANAERKGAYYDLSRGGARHDLGQVRRLDFSGGVIATLGADGAVAYYNLARGGARRVVGKDTFLLSDDGGALLTQTSDGSLAYFDIRNGGTQHNIAPLVHTPQNASSANTMLSDDGAFLVTQRDANVAYYNLRQGGAGRNLGALPRSIAYVLGDDWLMTAGYQDVSAFYNLAREGARIDLGLAESTARHLTDDRALLATLTKSGDLTVFDLENGAARRNLGNLGEFRSVDMNFSGDGAFLAVAVRAGDFLDPKRATVFDLARNRKHDLGLIESFTWSGKSAVLVTIMNDGNVAYYDFARGSTRRALGAFGTPASLGSRVELPRAYVSPNGAFLVLFQRNGRAVLFDLARGAARYDLGLVREDPEMFASDIVFGADGASVVARSAEGNAVLYDLSRRVWEGAAPPRGHGLRAAVCASSARALRPLPRGPRRGGADAANGNGEDARLWRSALRGRPWNPCDWRGLGAILPNAESGDGWFEGLRQWLRLISVRHFGAGDYRCEETTSAASAEQRAWRKEMCNLYAPMASADIDALSRVAGLWTGTYACDGQRRDLRLTLSVGEDRAAATHEFLTAADSAAPRGAYTMSGTLDAQTRELDLDPMEWVPGKKPDRMIMTGLEGTFDASLRTFRGRRKSGSCSEVRLTRS